MQYSLSSAAPYINSKETTNTNTNTNIKKTNNVTFKNKDNLKPKIKKEMIDNLAEYQNDDTEDYNPNPITQFPQPVQNPQNMNPQNQYSQPVQNPQNLNYQNQHYQNQQNQQLINSQLNAQTDSAPSKEGFSKINSTYASDYYKQFSPYQGSYQIPQSSNNSNHELLKKLDNILHLLEEQQEEKTNLITEELILYVFLGVFVIYVLDSFVKVGKYTR